MTQKKQIAVEMGKRLKELRDIVGKTQKEVAGDLGLKQSVLSSYENGDREPPIATLNSIARYYNVTVDYITGNSDIKSPVHIELNPLLDDRAISVLRNLEEKSIKVVNKLIACKGFGYLINILREYLGYITDDKNNEASEVRYLETRINDLQKEIEYLHREIAKEESEKSGQLSSILLHLEELEQEKKICELKLAHIEAIGYKTILERDVITAFQSILSDLEES